MNYVCAAGTGSFIEEQAIRLNVPLEKYSEQALGTSAPLTSDRCTVFMERDINHFLSQGYSRNELLAAALHSVRDNYLSKVAHQNKIGKVICFQGATAKNKALVTAFEQKLNTPIIVSRYCHLTGALGVCLLLKEQKIRKTLFFGVEFYKEEIKVSEEICEHCKNHCKLNNIKIGSEIVTWGFLCGRDDPEIIKRKKEVPGFDLLSDRRKVFRAPQVSDYIEEGQIQEESKSLMDEIRDFDFDHSVEKFKENLSVNVLNWRHKIFTFIEDEVNTIKEKTDLKIGIPNALYVNEFVPFWKLFFAKLGYATQLSSQKEVSLQKGKELAEAEFCAPISNWHGHINELIEKVDYIFAPQMFEGGESNDPKFYCYYSNYAVALVCNNESINTNKKLITPIIDFSKPAVQNIQQIYESLPQELKLMQTPSQIQTAYTEAWTWFTQKKENLTRSFNEAVYKGQDISVILLGPPYVVLDKTMNKMIPQKFNELGITTYFQDMLPYSELKGEN